jgi:hypothetical protein
MKGGVWSSGGGTTLIAIRATLYCLSCHSEAGRRPHSGQKCNRLVEWCGKIAIACRLAVTWKSGPTTFISFNPGKPIAILIFCTADSMLATNYHFQMFNTWTREKLSKTKTVTLNPPKRLVQTAFFSITLTSQLNDLYIYTKSLAVSFRYYACRSTHLFTQNSFIYVAAVYDSFHLYVTYNYF